MKIKYIHRSSDKYIADLSLILLKYWCYFLFVRNLYQNQQDRCDQTT